MVRRWDPSRCRVTPHGESLIALPGGSYGKNGPGDSSRQTASRLKLSNEKQNEMETGEEFGGRLLQLNDTLIPPIDDTMLCSIFVRGLRDSDLAKFILREQLTGKITDLGTLKDKCDDYECWTVSLPYLAGSLSRLAPLGYYLEPGTELTGSVESAGARGTGIRVSRSEEKKCESRG